MINPIEMCLKMFSKILLVKKMHFYERYIFNKLHSCLCFL